MDFTILFMILVAIVFFVLRHKARNNAEALKEEQYCYAQNRKSECKLFLQNNQFNTTKVVSISNTSILYIDTDSKRFLICNLKLDNNENFRIYKYSDIINAELYEDGVVTQRASVGGALVGGVLAGGAGAVVGSQTTPKTKGTCKLMFIKLTVKDVENPYIQIDLIRNKEYDKSGKEYMQIFDNANRIIATFSAMKES